MPHLATNQYPWGTFYQREGRSFEADLDASLGEIAAAGLDGFEPIAVSAEQVDALAGPLTSHGLEMRSVYVNATLHDSRQVEEGIEHVLAVAARAKPLGTRIFVTNPNPISWSGQEGKNDAQLETQAAALDRLGGKLADVGLTLAYHFHAPEMRHAAREFHHMLVGTDPARVKLCLDAHWVFRGADNSAVAAYDVVKLYGPRVAELHLRQSVQGVWCESFGPGDLDYPRIARDILALGLRPHLVLEQAVEDKTPRTLSGVQAHRQGAEYARRILADFAT